MCLSALYVSRFFRESGSTENVDERSDPVAKRHEIPSGPEEMFTPVN